MVVRKDCLVLRGDEDEIRDQALVDDTIVEEVHTVTNGEPEEYTEA